MKLLLALVISASTLSECLRDRDAESAEAQASFAQRQSAADSTQSARDEDSRRSAIAAIAVQQNEMQEARAEDEKRVAALRLKFKREHDHEAWIKNIGAECSSEMNAATCDLPPDSATAQEVTACKATCEESIKASLEARIESALADCAVSDEIPPRCSIQLPTSAFATAKPVAGQSLEAAVAETNAGCAKLCAAKRAEIAEDARERPKANAVGESLVLAYKKCMLATDSTRQALTYRIHDSDLYQDLMAKSDARCRAANRCDWLEKHSDDWRCAYGNN